MVTMKVCATADMHYAAPPHTCETRSETLLAILEDLPLLVMMATPDGTLTFVNKIGQQMIGLPGSPVGAAFADVAHPFPQPEGNNAQSNCPDKMCIRNSITGEEIPLQIELIMTYNEAGVPDGFACIGTDLRKHGKSVPGGHSPSQPERSAEAVCQIAGRIAHDLNNALQVINAYSEFLSDQLGGDARLQAKAKSILRGGERAARLVEELLSISHV